ncbi:MAG: lipid II flippase MurJ [Actinomycetes bacterium]
MRKPIGMGSAALIIGASVLLSRFLGLLREVLLASMFGVSTEGDLYRHAFLIPDFLNYLVAGAYLTITLVPLLSRRLEEGGPQAASHAFTAVFRFVAVAIVSLTALMWLFAGPLVGLVFPEVEEQAWLVTLTRLVLPAQVFLVLGSLLMAVQYTHRRFLMPALAPLVYNLGIIVGGLAGNAIGRPGPEWFLVGAVAGSAVGNFLLQWLGAKPTGTWFVPGRDRAAIRQYLLMALPLMVGQSVAALDEQFVRFFGQVSEGATSALSFARQLNMLPVGVVAQAAGVAAFPFLARLAARGDHPALNRTTARTTRLTIFVSAAATAALIALAVPLVRVLFAYGRFTASDTEVVASLLSVYAFSIPLWGIHQIMSRHFYAQGRMWLPVVIGTAALVPTVPMWIAGRAAGGERGMAIASTLSMLIYAGALTVAWWREAGGGVASTLLPTLYRSAAAGTLAALAGRALANSMFSAGDSPVIGILTLFVAGAVTAVVFVITSLLVRSPELKEVVRRRQVSADPALPGSDDQG